MSHINMKSILNKAAHHMNDSDMQKEIDCIAKKVMSGKVKIQIKGGGKRVSHTPEEAATKFIEVLKDSISSSGLSPAAISAISELSHEVPRVTNSGTYIIEINFSGDLSRPSLDESKYGSIKNLAALFNAGVDHIMKPVHGTWHNKEYWSRTEIPGARFMEQAKHTFMSSYGSEYNVVDIRFDDEFV